MELKRNNSIDLLRIIACLMVICIHVSAEILLENMNIYTKEFVSANFFDSFSRGAVPIFIMISGMFLLDNEENKKKKEFYKKKIKEIYVPTILWSFIYIFLRIVKAIKENKQQYFNEIFREWIRGVPYYHLWYLYSIVGLYIITPFLVKYIKNKKLSIRQIIIVSIIVIVAESYISYFYNFFWFFDFILYFGYFILGYGLKKAFKNKNIKKLYFYLFLLCYIISSLAIFFTVNYIFKLNIYGKSLYFYEILSPLVIIASISIVGLFLNLKKNIKISTKVVCHTFNIYMVHPLFLYMISYFKKFILSKVDVWLYIPFISIVVFILSMIFSIFLKKIIYFIKKRGVI